MIAANAGYRIVNVVVDGVSAGAVSSCTFTAITANRTMTAAFALSVSSALKAFTLSLDRNTIWDGDTNLRQGHDLNYVLPLRVKGRLGPRPHLSAQTP
jgi:hypothetical protein